MVVLGFVRPFGLCTGVANASNMSPMEEPLSFKNQRVMPDVVFFTQDTEINVLWELSFAKKSHSC